MTAVCVRTGHDMIARGTAVTLVVQACLSAAVSAPQLRHTRAPMLHEYAGTTLTQHHRMLGATCWLVLYFLDVMSVYTSRLTPW